MKKITITVLLFFSVTVYSHDFLTEILIYSDDYDTNPYNVAVTYELGEDDILKVSNLRTTKSKLSELVEKSDTKEFNRGHHRHGEDSTHEIEFKAPQKTHGVFDHATEARLVAIDLCNAVALSNYRKYSQGLIPQFTGPSTFTDGYAASEDHHDLYDYADGLSFNCVELIEQ